MTKIHLNLFLLNVNGLKQGLPPLKPRLTFCLETKSKQEVQETSPILRTPSPKGDGKVECGVCPLRSKNLRSVG